jgi:hypothetical protein
MVASPADRATRRVNTQAATAELRRREAELVAELARMGARPSCGPAHLRPDVGLNVGRIAVGPKSRALPMGERGRFFLGAIT